MSGPLSSLDIETAARRICAMLDARAQEFNQLDALSGDGDMGATLQIVARAVLVDQSPFPADLGQAFSRLATTLARTSGSSLCAVIMTGLMSLSRANAGRTGCTAEEFLVDFDAALAAMQVRSRARFGDKTILDGLKAIADAGRGSPDFSTLSARAGAAVTAAVIAFRAHPSQIGRARLAADKGAGLDDPGMVMLVHALEAVDHANAGGAVGSLTSHI